VNAHKSAHQSAHQSVHQSEDADLFRELAALETSAISDVLEGLGFPRQVLHESIRPLTGQPRLVGKAACAALGPRPAGAAPARSGDYFSSVDELCGPGQVLVLAVSMAAPGAAIGGFMGREYQRRGTSGVVTNGMIRDAAELGGLGFAVFGSGVTPRNGGKNLQVDEVGATVMMPGSGEGQVQVGNGDFLVADTDGIVVIPVGIVFVVVEASLQLAEMERRIAKDMERGMSRIDAMRAHDRFAHLPALRAGLEAGSGR
jgi:regulator of RNase E activity RraA